MLRILAAAALAASLAVPAGAARIETGDIFFFAIAPFWDSILLIGTANVGALTVDGGTQTSEDSIALGGLPGGDGTLTVTGAGSELVLDGDDVTRASALTVASEGIGTVLVEAGGRIDVDGSANQPGDLLGANMVLGFEDTGIGAVTITGAGSEIRVRNGGADAPGVSVGFRGLGTLLVSEGGLLQLDTGSGASGGAQVGGTGNPADPGGEGHATVTGAGSRWELVGDGANLSVGSTSLGTLTLEDGGAASANNLFVGLNPCGDGTVHVAGGSDLTLAGTDLLLGFGGSANVGMAGSGALHVEDASVALDNQDGLFHGLQVGGTAGCGGPCPFTGGTGSVVLEGPSASLRVTGPLGFATIGADGSGSLHASGGALFEVEDPTDASGTSVAPTAGVTGTVTLEGAGTLFDAGGGLGLGVDLATADAGTARFQVGAGAELRVGPGGAALGSDAVLGGAGQVTGDVFNLRGTLSPGDPRGVLALDGGYQQSEAGALLRIELAGRAPGEWDRLSATGDVLLDAGTVRFEMASGFLPSAGDEFPFADTPGALTEGGGLAYEAAGAADLDFEVEIDAPAGLAILRVLSNAAGFGACQAGQLKALSKLCKKALACEGKRLGKPARDADGAKRDACVAKARDRFARAWDKAAAKGDRKGEPCALGEDAAAASDLVLAPAGVYLDDLLVGWDEAAGDADDDKLRSALVKQGGALCSKLLAADASQMKRRSDVRRAATRAKARARFDAKVDKALAKAAGRGVVYGGADRDDLADRVASLVGDATGRTAGLSP